LNRAQESLARFGPICWRHSRLSGAESIANVTGVMKLDPGSTMGASKRRPRIDQSDHFLWANRSCRRQALLGWAMLSLPSVLGKTLHLSDPSRSLSVLQPGAEDMLRFIGEQFATATFSPAIGNFFGWIVGSFSSCSSSAPPTQPSSDDRIALHDVARIAKCRGNSDD